MQLETGQVAVITGGANGIGFAFAEELGQRGLRIVLADILADPLDAAAEQLSSQGLEILAVPTDVRDAAQVQALADVTLERFGRVDLVCNNAGVAGPMQPMWEQDLSTWRWVLDVALMGVVHGIRSFVPHLIAQNSGHILNTASVGGLIPLPTMAPYHAAKVAVVGLSETLQQELQMVGANVGVTVLCPGLVRTNLGQTSALNRPADLDAGAFPMPSSMDDVADTYGFVLTAADAAHAALDGVEHDRLHVIPTPGSDILVRARVEALLADLPASS